MNSSDSNHTARGFNFFPQHTLRPMVALGKTTPHAQNSTFASPSPNAPASACKRAAFLPSHPTNEQHSVLLGKTYNNMIN